MIEKMYSSFLTQRRFLLYIVMHYQQETIPIDFRFFLKVEIDGLFV